MWLRQLLRGASFDLRPRGPERLSRPLQHRLRRRDSRKSQNNHHCHEVRVYTCHEILLVLRIFLQIQLFWRDYCGLTRSQVFIVDYVSSKRWNFHPKLNIKFSYFQISSCLRLDFLFYVQMSRNPRLQTGNNLLVCNMSVSDIFICLSAAPLTPITSFYGRWYLGNILCKILPPCQVCQQFISRLHMKYWRHI